ncbi:MAG: hypothetical protein AAF351_01205 [Pseudomonadota bacterium]
MYRYDWLLVPLLLFASNSAASPDVIFACNYGVDLTVDGAAYSVSSRSRSRVRDTSTIPLNFQNHRLKLRVTEIENDAIRIDILLAEEIDGVWQNVYPEPPHMEVSLGGTTNWTRVDDIMQLQLSIICSRFHG